MWALRQIDTGRVIAQARDFNIIYSMKTKDTYIQEVKEEKRMTIETVKHDLLWAIALNLGVFLLVIEVLYRIGEG